MPKVTRLPVSLQRHFNTYLSGALPLCVVLGNELDAWFMEHYIELHSYEITLDPGVIWIDFMDTYTYRQVLDTKVLSRTAAEEIRSLSEYLVAAISNGEYVTVFLDDGYLRGTSRPFIHELLFYGFDPVNRHFVTAGFNGNRLFEEMDFPFRDVDLAFRRGLQHMRISRRWQDMTSVAQRLKPFGTDSPRRIDVNAILGKLAGYAASVPPADFDPFDGYWWYSRRAMVSTKESVRIGLDVYDDARRHLHQVKAGTSRYDYRLFHVLTEHKRLLLSRMRAVVAATAPGPDVDEHIVAYTSFVKKLERLRLASLKYSISPGARFPAAHDGYLDRMKAEEQEILGGFLARFGSS